MLLLLAHQALLQAFAVSACVVHCVPNEYEGMTVSKKKKKKSREASSSSFVKWNLNDEYQRWLSGDNDDEDEDYDDDDDHDADADADDSRDEKIACHDPPTECIKNIRTRPNLCFVGGKRQLDDILLVNHNIGPTSTTPTATTPTTNGMNCCGEPQSKRCKIDIWVLDPPPPPPLLSFLNPPSSQGSFSTMKQTTTTKMTRVSYCPISNMVVQESFVFTNSCWYPNVNGVVP
jgi:hypothetical protein